MTIKAGDIYWIDFDPAFGTEQKGRRPALVISVDDFNDISRRSIVCPITTRARDWPSLIELPSTVLTNGFVMADQVRSIDRPQRLRKYVERVPPEFLNIVRARLGLIIGLQLPPAP